MTRFFFGERGRKDETGGKSPGADACRAMMGTFTDYARTRSRPADGRSRPVRYFGNLRLAQRHGATHRMMRRKRLWFYSSRKHLLTGSGNQYTLLLSSASSGVVPIEHRVCAGCSLR